MPRRSDWSRAWRVLSDATTRHTLRTQKKVGKALSKAVARAVTDASVSGAEKLRAAGVVTPVRKLSARGAGRWEEGRWGLGPLAQRNYRLYIPEAVSVTAHVPLLVLLHGCGQDAASFATSTHAAAVARAGNCMLLLPEQSVQANAQRCWNWFRSDVQVGAEATILMAIIERICSLHPVQPGRVHLLGMSAGASMALTLALRYPDRFAAVCAHSGPVPHSAHNAAQASQAMQGHRVPDADALRIALAGRQLPPLMLVHGEADRTVVPDNALECAALWLELLPRAAYPIPAPGAGRNVQRGKRRGYNVIDWKLAGRPYIRLIRVAGLAHAWSGGAAGQAFSDPLGPDALRLALRFFADSAAPPGAVPGEAGTQAPILREGLTWRSMA